MAPKRRTLKTPHGLVIFKLAGRGPFDFPIPVRVGRTLAQGDCVLVSFWMKSRPDNVFMGVTLEVDWEVDAYWRRWALDRAEEVAALLAKKKGPR